MAHSLSAKKRIRQNEKHRARNRARKEGLKLQGKALAAAITKGDKDAARTELNKLSSRLAKVASKRTIHKNTAARKRSRATKRFNAMQAAKAGA